MDSSKERSDHCKHKPKHCPPSGHEDLLTAIALEELALAHIINAEAEKAQAVTKMPITPFTPDELIAFQQSLAKVLEMVVAKEALLLKKLRLLLAQCERPCPKCKRPKRRHQKHPHHCHCDEDLSHDLTCHDDHSDSDQSDDDDCHDGHPSHNHHRKHHPSHRHGHLGHL